jgi:hypothetical protein
MSDVAPEQVNQFVEAFRNLNFRAPERDGEESSEEYEDRVDAAAQMADIRVSGQLSEVSQQVFVTKMYELFEAGNHLYVRDIADLDNMELQLDGMLDALLPGQVSKHVRSKLRAIVTKLMPALREHGQDLKREVIESLGTNSEEVGAPHNMYTAAVGIDRAKKQGVMDTKLAADVAKAINTRQDEHSIRALFERRGVQFETKRETVCANASLTIGARSLLLHCEVPEGFEESDFREALWDAMTGFSFNMRQTVPDGDGKTKQKPVKVQIVVSY